MWGARVSVGARVSAGARKLWDLHALGVVLLHALSGGGGIDITSVRGSTASLSET